jgi:phosphoglycerol transferase MdoB-like AlkP superfamily enzyme
LSITQSEARAWRALSTALRFTKQLCLPILQIAAVATVLCAVAYIARNEPSLRGALAVFLLLALPIATLLLWSPRTLSISFATAALLVAIERSNFLKYSLIQEHLHVFDIMALWEYVGGGDFVLLRTYADMVMRIAGIVAAGVLTFVSLRYLECRIPRSWAWQGSRRLVALFLVAAACNTAIFFTGNYFWSISNQFIFIRMKHWSPFTFSYLLSSGFDAGRVFEELGDASSKGNALRKLSHQETGPLCENCPDIITIHVESVFDPKMLAAYGDDPTLTEFLNPRLQSINGPLKTHVAGGMSMISEFLFNCGIDHYAFGTAGSYPNLFVPRVVSRCTPGYLRDGGYQTQMVTSVVGNGMRYTEVYKAYGVDKFFEPGSMGIPIEWFKMRDRFFVDAAIDLLQRPRAAPRLTMLLTVWNHGPHGKTTFADRSEIYSGPYDISKAGNELMKDYINRLNDSITAFRRLEDYVEMSPVPTVIVYYGDHHPNIPRDFSTDAQRKFGNEVNYVTFYRIARNFGTRMNSRKGGEYIGLDQLFRDALVFGGIRLSPELRARDAVLAQCRQTVSNCNDEQRRVLRSIILK